MRPTSATPFRLIALTSIVFAWCCVTVNVYFPETAVRNMAEKIEDAVDRQAEDSAPPGDAGSATETSSTAALPGSALARWLGSALVTLLPAGTAYAAGDEVVAPEISSPAIRKIIKQRATRVARVNQLKAQGVLGENKDALLEIRSLDSLALQERAAAQKLVRDENTDREEMFKEIAAATGTDLSQLPQIRATYAATLRERAHSGEWIQKTDRSWVKKP